MNEPMSQEDFELACAECEGVKVSTIKAWRKSTGGYSNEKIDDMYLGYSLATVALEKQKAITRRVSAESNRLFDEKAVLIKQLEAAVRVALGFSADADDVSPSDLVDAIAGLQEQVRSLAAECKAVYAHALEEGYQFYPGGIEYTDAALREIRAQVLDDMADDCEADWLDTYIDELRSSAARIRAGEQP